MQLFKGYPEKLDSVIVKFGQLRYLKPMLEHGHLRLSPAQFYNNPNLASAMQDNETERWFHFPQFDVLLQGKTHIRINGIDVEIEDGFLKFSVECPNYMLWSECKGIDRRLPTDFGANAALIIRNVKEFTRRFQRATKAIWPNTPVWCGDIKYYDPTMSIDMSRRPETIKHFSYLYQQEWRFCAFPFESDFQDQPVNLALGSLEDIAELVTL